jgi:hypothetical protein
MGRKRLDLGLRNKVYIPISVSFIDNLRERLYLLIYCKKMVPKMIFHRLHHVDGSWQRFLRDWEAQCARLGEDFESYHVSPIQVVQDLTIGDPEPDAGVFGLEDESGFHAICQVNCANIPGYAGKVLRVRMMYFSPSYDLGERGIEDYAIVLIRLFTEILALSNGEMQAPHIKFHLRSPADRQFFAALGTQLDKTKAFASVGTRGAWLYITK